ncbi:hypothetical protein ASPWEDRAFT_311425 [Aspergillus wentii DTO 134E9]|uniref:Uncharacterized protein n=1 Tax=Aspergillus wentii DTO 134E9 TaxID=1073089 RepID=A0A1L9RTA1_ASPWE|nr:uncharacterized protein ASPWEDRAFT_311425 [Aspergillus wentii DTO 134E9]KAI9933803.1 hypothetical protein MW887_004875 [Aspergillus wentii]OJJ38145.1 hypothetical protein ASPWEDRAFT_311425 [Aspergillus wentii DTO 134E9]
MHQWTELHESRVAPSPIVPTCRPSPPLSKRKQYSMANSSSKQQFLSSTTNNTNEGHQACPPGSPDNPMKNENVAELMRYLQTHNAPPQSQSNGARDILKAGHRRLRQLAQRQRKESDPRSKEEDNHRHLRALQREGFLQAPVKKKSEPKKSLDSSRSISNFSMLSSSRRDVESIGQPWLERQSTQDSTGRLSSLDLSELNSLVEAAAQFEDTKPPPYQPPETTSTQCDPVNEQTPDKPLSEPNQIADSTEHKSIKGKSSAASEAEDHVSDDNVTPSDGTSDTKPPVEKPQVNKNDNSEPTMQDTNQEQKADEPKGESSSKGKTSTSPVVQHHPNPAPSLKLFPDTLPPRMSSKTAWRISNCRLPIPNAPPGPDSQQGSSSATAESSNAGSKPSSTRPSLDDFPKPNGSVSSSSASAKSPTKPADQMPPPKSKSRPTSLQMSAINAFPLPAPMRPLPSLPGSASAHPPQDKKANSNRRPNQALVRPSDLPTPPPSIPSPLPSPRGFPKNSSPEKDSRPRSSKGSAPSEAQGEHKAPGSGAQEKQPPKSTSSPPESPPLVRMRQSRAERVRALKLKDLSASRLYLTGSDSPRGEETRQSFDSQVSPRTEVFPKNREAPPLPRRSGEDRTDVDRCVQKPIASGLPSPPPVSSLPSDPPAHYFNARSNDKRHCTSPIASNTASNKQNELSPPSRLGRSSSTRSASLRHERVHNEEKPEQLDCALPSSDDECMGAHSKEYRSRPKSSRRKQKPGLGLDADSLHAAPRVRKASSSNPLCSPSTPRDRSYPTFDKSSPQSLHSQDSQASHARTVKLLESRIAQLERQNKILQAALSAALDAGGKDENALGMSTSTSVSASTASSATGTSFSSTTTPSPVEETIPEQGKQSRMGSSSGPAGWNVSRNNGPRASTATTSSRGSNFKELEDIIAGFEFGWTLDVPNGPGATQPAQN